MPERYNKKSAKKLTKKKEGIKMAREQVDKVYFEAVLHSESKESMFAADVFLGPENIQKFVPPPGRGIQVATILQSLGFRVWNIGTFSISGEAPRELWEKVFGTRVEQKRQPISQAHPEVGEIT